MHAAHRALCKGAYVTHANTKYMCYICIQLYAYVINCYVCVQMYAYIIHGNVNVLRLRTTVYAYVTYGQFSVKRLYDIYEPYTCVTPVRYI